MTQDKYYIYRPLLDMIGGSEGTDKGRKYNETLAYGKLTGGDVELVKMTLDEIEALQTKMLRHPKNVWKSSALGRYQIIRTTLRVIRAQLRLTGAELFDEDMQDRMACFLLGVRGIDKFLAGRLSLDTMLDNLSAEWASIPNSKGVGTYGGQGTHVAKSTVIATLAIVQQRHDLATKPAPKPTPAVVKEVIKDAEVTPTSKTLWATSLSVLSTVAVGFGDFDKTVQLAFIGAAIVFGAFIMWEHMRKGRLATTAKNAVEAQETSE